MLANFLASNINNLCEQYHIPCFQIGGTIEFALKFNSAISSKYAINFPETGSCFRQPKKIRELLYLTSQYRSFFGLMIKLLLEVATATILLTFRGLFSTVLMIFPPWPRLRHWFENSVLITCNCQFNVGVENKLNLD